METSLTKYCKENINAIHTLSSQCNTQAGRKHINVLLCLAEKHIPEINELFDKHDDHAIVETGDLLILCMEIIKESGHDIDEVMDKCYKRFRRKLKGL